MTAAEFADRFRAGEASDFETVEGDVVLEDAPDWSPISNTRFKGRLLFRELAIPAIVFQNCQFERDVEFAGCVAPEGIWLVGCHISGNANCCAAIVGLNSTHGLTIERSTILGELNCRDIHARTISLSGSVISGDVTFAGGKIDGDVGCAGATFGKAFMCWDPGESRKATTIAGELDFHDATIKGGVFLISTSIGTDLTFASATLGGHLHVHDEGSSPTRVGGNLVLRSATCNGLVVRGLQVAGEVNLAGINCDGSVEFHPLPPPKHPPVDARQRLHLELEGGFKADVVTMRGGAVKGDVKLQGIRCSRLRFENAAIQGDLVLTRAEHAATRISEFVIVERSTVGGDLSVLGVQIREDLFLRSLHVGRHLRIADAYEKRCRVGGYVDLHTVDVGGDITFAGVQVAPSPTSGQQDQKPETTNCGILLQAVTIKGHLTCATGALLPTRVEGVFGAVDCTIARGLQLQSLDVEGDIELRRVQSAGDWSRSPSWLDAVRAGGSVFVTQCRIAGDVDLGRFECKGDLRIRLTEIDGDLRCQHALTPAVPISFAFEQSRARTLTVHSNFASAIALTGSSCDALILAGSMPATIDLGRFTFQSIEADGTYAEILKRAPIYRREDWYVFESWIRSRGRDEEASDFYLAMRRYERSKRKGIGVLRRIWDALADGALWLSLASHRPVIPLLLLMVYSMWLFSREGAWIYPENTGPAPTRVAAHSSFPGLWVGLQQSVPALTFVPTNAAPSNEIVWVLGHPVWTYADAAAIVQIAGWLLTILFVAALTGLARRVRPGKS